LCYPAIGGTFDFLHIGHKLFLTNALLKIKLNGKLVVGITSDIML